MPFASDDEKRRSFEQQAVPFLDAVYRMARRLAGDPTWAEDLAQETMLKAYRAWEQFRPGSNVKAWLLTILRNTFYNEYRRRHPAQPIGVDVDAFTLYDAVQDADPEGTFFEQLLDDEVVRAIDALPHEFRETLVLSDMEHLSYQQIAAITGVPVGTVKSRLFRARKLLQKSLYDYAVEMGYIQPSERNG
jgi:RNA polymerase sigma-70 factor (ECF subfamily)